MKTKGLVQPLVLAGILAVGFMVVWGLISAWTVDIGEHVAGSEPAVERLLFLTDGTPLVARSVGRLENQQYHDLEGNRVPPPEQASLTLGGASLPASQRLGATRAWNRRIRSFADGGAPAVFWYFLSDGRPNGTGYFVGYDSQSNACVGYLGTAGFSERPLAPQELIPFAGDTSGTHSRVLCTQRDHAPTEHPQQGAGGRPPRGSLSTWDVYVLGADSKIYHADLQSRTVHVALDEPRLRSAAVLAGPSDPVGGTPNRLAVRTDDAVLVLDEHGQILRRYLIPEALRGQDFTFAETTTGEALMHWSSPLDDLATETEHRIYWVTGDSRYRQAALTLPCSGGMRSLPVSCGVIMPGPLELGGFLGFSRARDLLEKGLVATYPEALGRAVTEFWPALVIAHLLAAGLAMLCYRRQVRYGARWSERVVWPLFVLALGLPGWVAYRFGRSWPVLEECPECGVGVPRDRGCCARCAAAFPGPALRGTEVFA